MTNMRTQKHKSLLVLFNVLYLQRHQVQTRLNVYPGNKVPSVSNQSEARVRIYWTLERRERKQNGEITVFIVFE